MTTEELYRAGKLQEAIQALGAEVRSNPTDLRRRTFLFELLCFAGEFDRAEKHLDLIAGGGKESQLGSIVYCAALASERSRIDLFRGKNYPSGGEAPSVFSGTLNGKPFHSLEDADPRIGARLEVFAGGQYLWIPFVHVASLTMEPPRRVRDLIWTPADLRTGPAFKGTELGEVLLPALYPLSWEYADDAVKLGRATEWSGDDANAVPVGQKLLLVDGEEVIPFLEVRTLEIATAESDQPDATSGGTS